MSDAPRGDPLKGRSRPGPLRIGSVFEVAVDVLARRWRTLLVLALLFAGPGAILTAVLGLRFNDVLADVLPDVGDGLWADVPTLTAAQVERLIGALGGYLLAALVAGLLGSIGAVAMSAVTLADRASAADLGGALRTGLRRSPQVFLFMLVTGAVVAGLALAALLAIWLSVSLLSGGPVSRGGPGVFVALVIGVALVVVLATLSMRWALAYPVLTVESDGWRGAMARSWQLSADHVWRIFVIVLAGSLVTVVVAAFISQVAALLLVDALATPLGLDPDIAETLALALGTVLLAPLSPVLLAATYGQLRLRQGRGSTVDSE